MELVMIPGQNVIMCDTVHGIMMAALKYVELIREHHPYEYGPRAIYRVIAARCCDAGVSAKLIRKFFSDCVEQQRDQLQHGSHQQPQFRDLIGRARGNRGAKNPRASTGTFPLSTSG